MFAPVDYAHDSPTTGGLGRIQLDGFSRFVKLVQAPRHWARWPSLPEATRETFDKATWFWRQEVDLYQSDLGMLMPDGMRLPRVYGVVDLGDDRLLLVLEDVETDDSTWERARFASAARLLGCLQVRLTRHPPLVLRERAPSELTQQMYRSRLLPVAIPMLMDERTWRHPLLAAHRRLRADLAGLSARLPALVDESISLPQLQGHGDTAPHNLLVPRDRPDTFVLIDWGMASRGAAGEDLGQLLIGLAHDGVLSAAELPSLQGMLIDAYTAGLADEGVEISPDVVRRGMDVGMVVRNAFTSLPVERLTEPPSDELAEHLEQRLALTRFLVELALDD